MDIIDKLLNGASRRWKDMGDNTHAQVVYVAGLENVGQGTTTDREVVVTTYCVKTAFPGALVNHTIIAMRVLDVSGDEAVQVGPTVWRNDSTNTNLSSAPSTENLSLVGATALTAAQLTAAGLALETTQQQVRDRLPAAMQTPGLLPVDTLGTPGVSRVQATSGTAASIVLTATCRRVSIEATEAAWINFSGTAAPIASGNSGGSHYIGAGQIKDYDVPANTTISVLQVTTAGVVYVTELV